MKTTQKRSLINRINRTLTKGRAAYEKADVLLQKLRTGMKIGEIVTLPTAGEAPGKFTLVDNFAEADVAYRVARVARYELKPVKAAKITKAKAEPAERTE